MGPQTIAMPAGPLLWVILGLSVVAAGAFAYELAQHAPPTWPRWPGETLRFIHRWYPRIIMPILLALGWLWL
jgi:hypothetical protein